MDIKNLNTEELVEIAGSSSPKKRDNKTTTVDRFIRRLGITRGSKRVPNYLIYYIYMTQHSEVHANKVNKIPFFRHFGQEFEQVRWGKQRFYLIDWPIEVTKELLERAKSYDRKYQGSGKNETKDFK